MTTKRVRTGRHHSVTRSELTVLKKYRLINGHECSLPIAEDDLSIYLNDGPFVLLRRKLKELLLISETHPKTKLFFRSSLRVGMEKQRHLRYYYYSIHPFSNFRLYWEILMGFVYLIHIIFLPIYGANYENPIKIKWSGSYFYSLNVVCFIDSFVNCCSGYVDEKTDAVVLRFKEIFKHYLFGYLLVDVISVLPTATLCRSLGIKVEHWMIMNRYFRVFRLITAIRYLGNILDIVNIDNHKKRIICRSIFFVIFVEYFTFVAYIDKLWIMYRLDLWRHMEKILYKLTYCTVRTLFLIQPHFTGRGWFNLIHQFLLLQFGNLFNAFLLARCYAQYNRINMVSRKYELLIGQVKEFARFKGLPETMHRMLLQFVDFKFGRRIYDEHLILSLLTPHLKDELFFLYTQKLMENVELFKNMPTSAIKRIAGGLKKEIVLPNDVIIQAGHEGSSMYFIMTGIVAVYTINGKEVCHLTDGANFGEIALLMSETRTASVVATDFCEVFKLQRKDFQEAIEPFPEVKEKMIKLATERFKTIVALRHNENVIPQLN